MNRDLPESKFFEDFYIWFNQDKKEEYYSTPLYYYKASFNIDYDTHTLKVYLKENEGTDNGLKHPATLYFPFVEKFGTFLVRFLNADLSTYESAYKDFFFAYGYEILRDLEEDFKFTLSNNFGNDETYLKETEKIYYTLKHKIIYIQEEMKDAIDYIFNIEDNEKLKDYTSAQRYAVYLIKQKGKLHTFNRNDYIIRDSFSNKYEQFQNTSEENLLNELKNKSMFISMIDTHKSNDLSSICYAVLEELVKTNNNPIKKCQNCGMYFIPNSRLDEIYCDYPKENGKTCREQGAILTYNKRLQEKSAYAEYRKTYQQKFVAVNKNKENKQLKKDFDKWKKLAKEKITKLKHGELTENEVYEWIIKNK